MPRELIDEYNQVTYREACNIEYENYQRLSITEDISCERLGEICQAERAGRCMVLPCKVGDTVWINFTPKYPANPKDKGKWFTGEAEIERIKLGVKGLSFQTYITSFTLSEIGKTVFFTNEAAVAALQK